MKSMIANGTTDVEQRIAAELEELVAAGVKLAPNVTPQSLALAEANGLVLDLETGEGTGTGGDRYTLAPRFLK